MAEQYSERELQLLIRALILFACILEGPDRIIATDLAGRFKEQLTKKSSVLGRAFDRLLPDHA